MDDTGLSPYVKMKAMLICILPDLLVVCKHKTSLLFAI